MRNKIAAAILTLSAVSIAALPVTANAETYRKKVWVCSGYSKSKANTGTLLGAGGGALLGSAVAGNGAKTEGAVLGGVVGAVAGHEIAKNKSKKKNCRYVWRTYKR